MEKKRDALDYNMLKKMNSFMGAMPEEGGRHQCEEKSEVETLF